MTKILYFYPDNPLNLNQGNNARANNLLHYFKSRQFDIDFVGEHKKKYAERENFVPQDLEKLKELDLINNGYLIRERKRSGLTYLFKYSIPRMFSKYSKDFYYLGVGQKQDFEAIFKENTYDYIIISYVLFTAFIGNKKLLKNTKIIVDTHDFFTAQFSSKKRFKLGKAFETEIHLLKQYDIIWTISNDEQFVFSQFLPNKKIVTIAHGLANKSEPHIKTTFPIDIFYIASKNPHNVQAAHWFFDKVYPLLDENIKITVVGRICDEIPDLKNVKKVRFAEKIGGYYQDSKITICPMLSGTGLKIKVVESLSFGKPVVCNERGVDGLESKTNNGCLVSNSPEIFAKNISKLLQDDMFYKKQAQAAQTFFSQSLDQEHIYKKLDAVFNL